MELTFNFKACVHYFLSNLYFQPNDSPSKTEKCFLFCMEKKELALEMDNLYDSPYSLMHIRLSDAVSNHSKTNLTWHLYACSKATIKTLEQDMKYV